MVLIDCSYYCDGAFYSVLYAILLSKYVCDGVNKVNLFVFVLKNYSRYSNLLGLLQKSGWTSLI